MKKMPDLSDEVEMLRRGRASALMSARNDAASHLRDACTAIQSADMDQLDRLCEMAQEAIDRLVAVGAAYVEFTGRL